MYAYLYECKPLQHATRSVRHELVIYTTKQEKTSERDLHHEQCRLHDPSTRNKSMKEEYIEILKLRKKSRKQSYDDEQND